MSFDRDCREWTMFAETLAEESVKRYAISIEKFLEWTQQSDPIQSFKELAHISKKRITPIMQDYMVYFKNRVRNGEIKSSHVNVSIRQIESFLDYHDIQYKKRQLNKMLPKMNKPTGNNAYSIDQIEQLLEAAGSLRNKAMILFLATSGARRGMIA